MVEDLELTKVLEIIDKISYLFRRSKMKKLFKGMHILVGMCLFAMLFVACPNNAQGGEEPNPAGKKDILIKSVTLGGISCEEGKDVFVGEMQAELIIELKEACEDLIVKVNNSATTVVTQGKKVKYNLQGITEAGLSTKIDITAKNKNAKSFNFVAKKTGAILIAHVRLNGELCTENTEAKTEKTTSDLSVTFKDTYQGLSVKVNGSDVEVQGKVATAKIENITETGVDVNIVATAKNKTSKTFKFKAVLKLGTIGVESVTFDDVPCAENATIDVNKSEGNVKVTFEQAYEGLSVTIAGKPATTLVGKVATGKVESISEEGTEIKIESTANGKKPFSYKFTLKKLKLSEIGIESVTFDDMSCAENATIETEKAEGNVKVTFVESYAGLSVTINDSSASLTGKVATFKISGIDKTDVKIKATATGKTPKEYKFKINKVLPIAKIKSLTIKAKAIAGTQDEKTYSATTAPLLSDIASDGSTKVGDAKEPKAIVKILFEGSPSAQKLKVENTTTNKSQETSSTGWGDMVTPAIELKKGDNNLVITYSEGGKRDLVYKLIVGFVEPEYEPISLISIKEKEYKTEEELAKLIQGTENFSVDEGTTIKVEVEMPELWYKDEGWSIKVDGSVCESSEFEKVGYNEVIYRLKKDVPLKEGDTKVVKIEFENTTRSYKKEYKFNVTHMVVHKLKTLIFMDPTKSNKEIGKKTYSNYSFDEASKCYITSTYFGADDRMSKAFFAVEAEDEAVTVEYALSKTKVTVDQIASWIATNKETISYKDYYDLSKTIDAYAIKDKELEYGSNFLYFSLQKGTTKTYYMQEIQREKLPPDNADGDYFKTIYQDADGTVLEDRSPISEKGLIRVLPKSPRATVELVTPEAKTFTRASDDWYECKIDLTKAKTTFSYNVVAENGTTKKLYNDEYFQVFTKSDALTEVKFDYVKDGNSWNRELVSEVDGKRYVNIDKKKVENKKIYLFISAFKGVTLSSHPDFVQESAETPYGTYTNYVFAVNVSQIMDNPNTNKEYSLSLMLGSKSCGQLKLSILPKDEFINSIEVCKKQTFLRPDGHYICKDDLSDSWSKALVVHLYFIDDNEKKNPSATNRAIKVFKDGTEIPMTVNQYETQYLEFKHQGFSVGEGERFNLTIQYFADKTKPTEITKTYTLEIEDI